MKWILVHSLLLPFGISDTQAVSLQRSHETKALNVKNANYLSADKKVNSQQFQSLAALLFARSLAQGLHPYLRKHSRICAQLDICTDHRRGTRTLIMDAGSSPRPESSDFVWFVKTENFKPSLSFAQIKPHLDAHKVWVARLREEGKSISSGYRVDAEGKPGGGGLMFFEERDFAAAERLVLQDPLVANDCVDWQLNQWISDVGNIALIDGGQWYEKRSEGEKR